MVYGVITIEPKLQMITALSVSCHGYRWRY